MIRNLGYNLVGRHAPALDHRSVLFVDWVGLQPISLGPAVAGTLFRPLRARYTTSTAVTGLTVVLQLFVEGNNALAVFCRNVI